MISRRSAVVLFALILALSGCGVEGSSPSGSASAAGASPPAQAPGEQVYATTCAPCHGLDARGVPNLGSDLTVGEFVASSDEDMLRLVLEGQDATDPANRMGIAMPARGGNPRLTDEQLAEVIAYLRELES